MHKTEQGSAGSKGMSTWYCMHGHKGMHGRTGGSRALCRAALLLLLLLLLPLLGALALMRGAMMVGC